ncbi:cyclase family protein [Nocardia sp. CA-135398]|uniref:cyclase family protein n=1 Tax=Nocardia sp. CA-135398 TaxID=3239977 RepID=UPI003D95EC28
MPAHNRSGLPSYCTWDRFSVDPERGTANYAGAAEVRAAAELVRRGTVFGLDYPLDAFQPPIAGSRTAPQHAITARHRDHRDDRLDGFWLQGSTHIDGLRHRRHAECGFYQGISEERITPHTADLGVNRWAEQPIVGRGVLIDLGRYRQGLEHPIDHRGGEPLDIGLLDDALAAQGTRLQTGDLLLLRTGWAHWYLNEATADEQECIRATKTCTGLAQSPQAIEWFAEHRVALAASDTFALERLPAVPGSPFGADTDHGMMHQELIALLGLPIGELWKLDELGADCATDGRYDCLLTVKPLNLTGGVGSPANATAIK